MSGHEAFLGVAQQGARGRWVSGATPMGTQEQFLMRLAAAHAPAMLGYALRLTGDPQAAREVVAQAMARAWHLRGGTTEAVAARSRMLALVGSPAMRRHR